MQIDEKTGFWILDNGQTAVNPAHVCRVFFSGKSVRIYFIDGKDETWKDQGSIELADHFGLSVPNHFPGAK
ncbi:MAG TPA: hypothetical protein VMX97_00285 [Hyphomicrobiaceae bacterium]|nr:hypothetical protein [Hyphomicrobiaceae bacterium]